MLATVDLLVINRSAHRELILLTDLETRLAVIALEEVFATTTLEHVAASLDSSALVASIRQL